MTGDQIWVKARSGVLVPAGAYNPAADTIPPAPPTGLAVTAAATTSCTLSWTASSDASGVDHYEVWRQGTPSVQLAAATGTTSTLGGLSPGTGYRFYIVAVDTAGNRSAPSTTVAVTTTGGTPPPTQTALWVGVEAAAPVDGTSETTSQTITRVHGELGGAVQRLYSTKAARPASWSAIPGSDVVDSLGLAPFWSTAADYSLQTAADPAYVAWLTALVQTFPTDRPVWMTTHHEPENDGVSAATFVAAYSAFYDLVKSVRPDIQVGPVYMTYQWASGRLVDSGGGPDAWTPSASKADFYGADTYCMNGIPIRPLADDTRHQRWHAHFAPFGKPLGVIERGLDHTQADGTDTNITQTLLADETWALQNGYALHLYWQAKGGINELQDVDTPNAKAAYRAIASRGRTA